MCGCSLTPGHNHETCQCGCHRLRRNTPDLPTPPQKPPRKIIQISTATEVKGYNGGPNIFITALCDDGTVWQKGRQINNCDGEWRQIQAIPQDGDPPRAQHAT